MKKFYILIEEHTVEKFKIEAEDMDEAFKIAEKKYYNGEIVLESGNVSHRLMSGETADGTECTDWVECEECLKMKQYEAVILTIERLGGVATLGELNHEIFKIEDCEWKTKTPFASIRRIVQQNKEIYKIKPGLYGLMKYKKENERNGFIEETEKNKDSEEMIEFNHSYYQGLLLEIGNLKKLDTFIPNQDKNRKFINRKLCDLSSLKKIPEFSYPEIIKRSSTIDVIWFDNRLFDDNEIKLPHSFFEVEHSTDIQNSLLKYNDLQNFYTEMFIVADEVRKQEFEKKISYSAFRELKENNRVKFLSYDRLVELYEITKKNLQGIIL